MTFSQAEEKYVADLLNLFKIIDTSEEIAKQCIKNRKVKKIKIVGNIIVSTAMVNGLTLVTRNIKDFNGLDVKILNPFEF